MPTSTATLLTSTQGSASVTGTPVRGNGVVRGSLYTVSITANNLQGRVYIEGSLVADPSENDWFKIDIPGISTEYIEFPYLNGNTVGNVTTVGFNFKGNITWIRARLDRAYLRIDNLNLSLIHI